MTGINLGSVYAVLRLNSKEYVSSLETARKRMLEFLDITNSGTQRLDALGAASTTAGAALTKGLSIPLGGIAAAIGTVAASFESAMSEVQAISGATGSELLAITNKAKEMGETTRYSATEAAGAFKYMSLAGWEASQQLQAIEGVLSLAAASNMDLAVATDIVTDNMTAFSLAAENATHVANVYAYTQSNANTDVSGLGEAMKYVSLAAHNMNIDIETTAAMIGKLADVGLKGSMAGTSLNMMQGTVR